jgi:hypothetical protein
MMEKSKASKEVLAAREKIEASLDKLLAGTDRKFVEASRADILATIDRAIAW